MCGKVSYMEQSPLRRTALAEELLAEIARKRASKTKVAAAAGIHPDTLTRKLANGEKFEISAFQLLAVCDYLEVPYADLIERARAAA
jgi:DNA-binding Xre family transcriptional regulator